ncbi:lipid-A-disaccharide synthase [Pseudolabrys sp. FHR47]|uniref:lipid-A-disaccharide synthase n=1 Tax=Pseudolabrys sp. FHR47 TaxID=2562284 RepID=UPI0010BEC366|nr:lipid-A-disaccharide synthase [Pseudolabrys sp. FHR47]
MTAAAPGPHVYLVAGEESGDRLGAALIRALRRERPDIRFSAVGGSHMADEGVASLFPLGELAIIGFAAIVKNLPSILKRINETADTVVAAKPDLLVIIDSPEFTHRVARKVRARAPQIPIVDYVCPSVWAWRSGRAKAMRGYVDRVLALLPFEPAAMARLGGPPTVFVGHPLAEQVDKLRPEGGPASRLEGPPLVLAMPGSRSGEVRRMAEVFGAALGQLAAQMGPFEVVVPTVERLETAVREAVARWPLPARVVTQPHEKYAAFRRARAALAKSGTSTLELALSGVPMVTGYKVAGLEAVVARLLIKVPSVILANLVLGRNVVPEFLQQDCTPKNLAQALAPLLADTPERRQQVQAFAELDEIMALGQGSPSEKAAAVVLATLQRI